MLKFSTYLLKPVLLLSSYAILPFPAYSDSAKSGAIGRSSAYQTKPIDQREQAGHELTFSREPTDEEALLNLNRRLNSLLEDFDEQLLNEQAILTQPKNESGSSSALGFGDDKDGPEENGTNNDASTETGEFPAQGTAKDQTAESKATKSGIQADSGGKQAPGITSGNDDDVVARQLREAAENETDPALRKKLWDEYRNYKNQ